MTQSSARSQLTEVNRLWPHRGGSIEAMLQAAPEEHAVLSPASDEVVARVEAVSICSSDIKVVRMGADHPLFSGANAAVDTVLGHEVCLRVQAVGADQAERFRVGQRLGLQPAMVVNGKRSIIGMDRPGGFARFLRLGPEALAEYVMDVPETVSAADVALLEPYGCVERAWRPNARQALKDGGRALVISAPGADFHLPHPADWREILIVGQAPAFLQGRKYAAIPSLDSVTGSFDDIIALGDLSSADLSRLCRMMAVEGLLLQGRNTPSPGPVQIDPARVHYDRLTFLGTREKDLSQAFSTAAQRFDVRPGGVALVHGGGGAMGRIHVHRLAQHPNGPRTIIASSRKGQRLSDIEKDFGHIAQAKDRRLVLADAESLPLAIREHAPGGLDDAVVVAPDVAAIEQAAGWLASDGLLAVFAGFPYGSFMPFDLSAVALGGKRLTGSTGCSVDDMRDVLSRVRSGTLDLSANIAAVAGLDALPQALAAVADGEVSGKIVIYPQRPEMPLRPVQGWSLGDEKGLTG